MSQALNRSSLQGQKGVRRGPIRLLLALLALSVSAIALGFLLRGVDFHPAYQTGGLLVTASLFSCLTIPFFAEPLCIIYPKDEPQGRASLPEHSALSLCTTSNAENSSERNRIENVANACRQGAGEDEGVERDDPGSQNRSAGQPTVQIFGGNLQAPRG